MSNQASSSDNASSYIEFDEVTKTYSSGQGEIHALYQLSTTIPKHSFSVFHGPSGSGKSTLLHLLGALDTCTGGSIRVDGKALDNLCNQERTNYRRHDVGFVFQSLNLLPNLTAIENVLVPFIPGGSSHKMRGKGEKLLQDVGLGGRMDHRPGQLSGGERQRVSIARALLKDPSLILADEPTGELDRETGNLIFELLREAHREQPATVVVVTHDTEYIKPDDRTVELNDGQIT